MDGWMNVCMNCVFCTVSVEWNEHAGQLAAGDVAKWQWGQVG